MRKRYLGTFSLQNKYSNWNNLSFFVRKKKRITNVWSFKKINFLLTYTLCFIYLKRLLLRRIKEIYIFNEYLSSFSVCSVRVDSVFSLSFWWLMTKYFVKSYIWQELCFWQTYINYSNIRILWRKTLIISYAENISKDRKSQ
jgi:hypothetical protein